MPARTLACPLHRSDSDSAAFWNIQIASAMPASPPSAPSSESQKSCILRRGYFNLFCCEAVRIKPHFKPQIRLVHLAKPSLGSVFNPSL